MTANLDKPSFQDLDRFLTLHAQAKAIADEMKVISDRFKQTVKAIPRFNPLETYALNGTLSFSTTKVTNVDIPKALAVLENKEKRRILLPSGLALKVGKSPELADAEGLLIVTRSDLVLRVLK
jgi:hypothetical protein